MTVADSPTSYTELLKKAIIGLEIKVTRIEGRFKLGQELPDGDWVGGGARVQKIGICRR